MANGAAFGEATPSVAKPVGVGGGVVLGDLGPFGGHEKLWDYVLFLLSLTASCLPKLYVPQQARQSWSRCVCVCVCVLGFVEFSQSKKGQDTLFIRREKGTSHGAIHGSSELLSSPFVFITVSLGVV